MVIVRNISGETVELEDFGLYLSPGEERDLSAQFSTVEISESEQLLTLVEDGYVVLNNGTEDLTYEESVQAVEIQTTAEDVADDPSTGGGWAVGPTPPANPSDGDGWFNTIWHQLLTFDASRNLWLSSRFTMTFAFNGNVRDKYLAAGAGHDDPEGHVYLLRDLVVCGYHVSIYTRQTNTDAGIALEQNYDNMGELLISNPGYYVWNQYCADDLNIQFAAGNRMQVYCWSNKAIYDPFMTLEVAWRVPA